MDDIIPPKQNLKKSHPSPLSQSTETIGISIPDTNRNESEQNPEPQIYETNIQKKQKKKKRTWLYVLLILILLFVGIPAVVIGYLRSDFEKQVNQDVLNPNITQAVLFEIRPGESVMSISKRLMEEDITTNKYLFYYYIKTRGLDTEIKSGEFEVTPGEINLATLTKIFTREIEQIKKLKVTIPEGFTSKQIEERLIETGFMLEEDDLINLANYKGEGDKNLSSDSYQSYLKLKKKYSFLNDQEPEKYAGLEGYLFPDTYIFKEDETLENIVDTMLDNFDEKVTLEMRNDIKKQGLTLHDVIKLASIVQRESGLDLETDKRVAGVFYNRLAIDMALGSCSTLQYVTEINKSQYTYEDTQYDSPYNTYINAGLPPGPIANPGIVAIEAAIYPEEHNYYYFLNTAEGELIFSETEEEHNAAQTQYLN